MTATTKQILGQYKTRGRQKTMSKKSTDLVWASRAQVTSTTFQAIVTVRNVSPATVGNTYLSIMLLCNTF